MVESPNTNTPYCSNCGYELTNLVDSSKCPECGKPLVEVLTRRDRFSEVGKRYRSKATLFGLPVLDIAMGPKNGERRGKARGIIAIGDSATGWLAFGGFARGIVAVGGITLGIFSIGGLSLGLLTAIGGLGLGGMAAGGLAVGGLANGGVAVGYAAQGGAAFGIYARGGQAWGPNPITGSVPGTPQAISMFDQLSWFFGAWPPSPIGAYQSGISIAMVNLVVAVFIGIIALLAWRREDQPLR